MTNYVFYSSRYMSVFLNASYSFYFHLKINVYVTGLNSLMNLDKLGHIDDKNIGLLNNSPENSIFEQ